MALSLQCPHCGIRLRLPDELRGSKVRCPEQSCGRPFRVPEHAAEEPPGSRARAVSNEWGNLAAAGPDIWERSTYELVPEEMPAPGPEPAKVKTAACPACAVLNQAGALRCSACGVDFRSGRRLLPSPQSVKKRSEPATRCPGCARKLRLPAKYSGAARCPACGKAFSLHA